MEAACDERGALISQMMTAEVRDIKMERKTFKGKPQSDQTLRLVDLYGPDRPR